MSSTFSSDIKLCIFDLDGTLVNTIKDLASSAGYALRSAGLPERTLQEYTDFVGNGTYMLIKRCLPNDLQDDDELCRRVHEAFSEHYSKHYLDFSYIYEGIGETVSLLKNKGVKLCVFTNKPDVFANAIINKLFPEETFCCVVGSRDGVPKKPDPTVEDELISRFLPHDGRSKDKSSVIHIGDSDVDIYTAHNACVKCIGCTWGFRSRESLTAAKADYIADKPSDIADILEKISQKQLKSQKRCDIL